MKNIITYGAIVLTAAAVGVTGGVVFKRVLGSEDVDYSNVDVFSMKVKCDELVKKIEAYNGGKEIVDAFPSYDVLNYAMEKYRRCENSYSFVFGIADVKITTQYIRTCQIKNGNQYFEESLSQSNMVSCGNRMLQVEKEGNVKLYPADSGSIVINDSTVKATYPTAKVEDLSGYDYSHKFGKTLDEMFIYLVSEKTVTSSDIQKLDNEYIITVTLDPDISTYFYKLQMKNISNLDKLPVFSNVTLKYTLTKDLMLKHLSTDEQYVATMMVDANTHGTLETYYYPNEYLKIPSVDETITYRKGA